MKSWYVIKAKPKQERAVLSNLSAVGYELFMPQIQSISGSKPLFPSYLFIKADLDISVDHRCIRYARGVSYIVGTASEPRPIDDLVVTTLKDRTRDGSLIEQELLFKAGEAVRVKRGMLKDLIGIVEKHLSSEQRVQILFKWWSTSMRTRLKYTELEKAA